MDNNLHHNKLPLLSKLSCKIDDFSAELLEFFNAKSKGDLYTKFLRTFFNYIPVDYRSKNKITLFGDFTQEAFNFFSNKKNQKRKVDIVEDNTNNIQSTTILIASDNKPFIIDSLNGLLSKLALKTIFAFYPVINAVRDKEGNLIDITEKTENATLECLVYIKILGHFDNITLTKIQLEINNVLDLVDHTYDAWETILSKVIHIINDINHNKETYKHANLPAQETLDFLNWLQKNHITFLGAIDFNLETGEIIHEEGVKEIWQENIAEVKTIIGFSKSDYYSSKLIMLGKIHKISPVHRNSLVDYILVKKIDKDGVYRKGTIIFGLYGSAVYFQSIDSVPILRQKMDYVLSNSKFPADSYNAKKLKNIIESLPRDVLIQIDESDLYCMCIHMLSTMRSNRLKLFIQQDWSGSFINIIIFLRRDRLTPEVYNSINDYLVGKFGNNIIADNITVVAQNFTHLFATIATKDISKLDLAEEDIERDLIKITANWCDDLLQKMCEEFGEYEGSLKHKEVINSFSAEYKHKFEAHTAIADAYNLEKATKNNNSVFSLLYGQDNEFFLKIYNPEIALILSDILPAIENLGFTAIDEQSFAIQESQYFKKSWIYEFRLKTSMPSNVPHEILKTNVEEALVKISTGEMLNDPLSKLIIACGFDWIKVKLIKAITQYIHQTGFIYGKEYVQQTLLKHYKYTEMIIELFESIFCPNNSSQAKAQSISEHLIHYLETVSSNSEDKVLKNIYLTILAITRTNFYQKDDQNIAKRYFSFKFDSTKVPDLSLPIPYAEIFVYSNEFEGIHLRGGKVARGGIRWSDRGEDYRTEVLGLMKAQMTKNTIIVPVGAKGAFYLNFKPAGMDKGQYMQKVIACYQNFIRGLLDLTDNIVDGKIVSPADTKIYDDENPYLVVAADKGTASFSDFANAISKEYNFWLDDAFASGGSAGYDHKKMGITAKGAWIATEFHFRDKAIDIHNQPFTIAGIGDMSGDLFGNFMLSSMHMKLMFAFNHEHIFIDPHPDCKISYLERQRLFNLPGSKWSDYNPALISLGGGVFERSAKTISISEEVRKMLAINKTHVTPDELIRAILKADVDLLWNGGIGTYIKSSVQNNIDIGDKGNDNLRINGNEVRAKILAEGGNIGVSQLGRIEYALHGGAVNTDFIDNSAGVDCSDHEVNIKIALNMAVAQNKITIDERNEFLAKMTQAVEKLVLIDNYDQNLAITIAQFSPVFNLESCGQLIKELEKKGLLNREMEFLPSTAELARRYANKQEITRPELAILLSYSKMALDQELTNSFVADDQYFEKHLLDYFPEMMRDKFKAEIENYPLKKEIIRTIITNKLINQLGGVVISAIKHETGAGACDIARAYEVVTEIFDLQSLWEEACDLPNNISTQIKVDIFSALGKIMRRGITWFVRNINSPIQIAQVINEYRPQTEELTEVISEILVGSAKTIFFSTIEHYTACGISENFAKSIATLEVLVAAFDIIYISKKTGKGSRDIANLYFECGHLLNIEWLRNCTEAENDGLYWNRLAIQSLKDDLYDKQRRLVQIIASTAEQYNNDIMIWLKNNQPSARIFTEFVDEIKTQNNINFNMIILASKKLEVFIRNLEVNK